MDRESFGGVMQVGSLVKWRYTDDVLYVVVAMVNKPIKKFSSIKVRGVRTGLIHEMFLSDLEIVCE